MDETAGGSSSNNNKNSNEFDDTLRRAMEAHRRWKLVFASLNEFDGPEGDGWQQLKSNNNSSSSASSNTRNGGSSRRRLRDDVMGLGSNASPAASSVLCECFRCGRLIGASRYAPHLEKCGSRVAARSRRPKDFYNLDATEMRSTTSSTSAAAANTTGTTKATSSSVATSTSTKSEASKFLTGNDGGSTTASRRAKLDGPESLADALESKKQSLALLTSKSTSERSKYLPIIDIICLGCKKFGKSDKMTLCDGCCSAFHLGCANRLPLKEEFDPLDIDAASSKSKKQKPTPPVSPSSASRNSKITTMPTAPWFCAKCISAILIGPPPELQTTEPKSAKEKIEIDGRTVAKFEIFDYGCDVCNKSISKVRWRCLMCPEFDVCQSCKDAKQFKKGCNATHVFVKFTV